MQSHRPDIDGQETSSAAVPERGLIAYENSIHKNLANEYLPDCYTVDSSPQAPESASSLTYENVDQRIYRPPHAPPSRCSRAETNSEFSDVGLETCPQCGATKLHHLASISRKTDVALFKEVVKSNLDAVNLPDSEGNTCIHFAAGAGAGLDQLVILQRAGADVTHVNHAGQTVLHVLNPHLYGRAMPAIITFALQQCLSFSQRDVDGKTPLHEMFRRTINLTNVHDLIPFLKLAGRSMTFLDRHCNTPVDILRKNWQKANNGAQFEQFEAKLIECNISINLRPLSHDNLKLPKVMPDLGNLAITGQDEITTDILDIVERSLHESYCQNRSNNNVLHALASLSFHANYQISCYMTPCGLWECLQHRLENSVNVSVDVNQYNSDGLTPLHSFLTATFDINLDISWLVDECVEMLLQYGADPRMRDRQGNTALHLACNRGRFTCCGKIISNLSTICSRQQYVQCLSATTDQGRTVVEEAEACMNSEPSESNERRKKCIGLVRARLSAATGEPIHSYMPAAYSSATGTSSFLSPQTMTWSSQPSNHGLKPTSLNRPTFGHHTVPSSFASPSYFEEPEIEMRSAFDD